MSALRKLSRSSILPLSGLQGLPGLLSGIHTSAPAQNADLITVTVDGKQVQVPKNVSVLQACEAAGIDVPRFCYHPRLSIAGNCRMCLVEIEKAPKPVASCAFPVGPNMIIKTQTPVVKKAREGVMEFLLINHPLDCPICDQGGECDLQDQAMAFGSDRGRFVESKRSVEDKNLGPFVKTVMTRCIHCTRCVRFASEVAGVPELGVTGRGNASEIGTYVEKLLTSELSGNVIDLCPVGALTSKPAAFTGRSWELRATETVDVSDGLGSNIRVDSRGTEVMRIVPRLNESINEEWISDKARFQYDGLRRQRLHVPYVRGKDGRLSQASWAQALAAVAEGLKGVRGEEIRGVAGRVADLEAMTALKDLLNRLGSSDTRPEGFGPSGPPEADLRSTYLLNSSILGLEGADAVLLVGTNPRVEAPVLNARLRKAWTNGAQIASVGPKADLTYPHTHLGDGATALSDIASGKSDFLARLKAAKRPAIVVGSGVALREDRDAVLQVVHKLVESAGIVRPSEGWNGYNVLSDSAARVGALDVGFVPGAAAKGGKDPKVVFLLHSDDYLDSEVPADAFVIYQGSHGDRGAARADVVLPGAAYTEKSATYVNTEGRVQRTRPAVPLVGDAREDWAIIRALSDALSVPLPYSTADALRARMADIAPHLAKLDAVSRPLWLNGEYFKSFAERAAARVEASRPLASSVENFYMTDAISRASLTMAKAVQSRKEARA